MQPMKLRPLYDLLIERDLIDPTIRKALPMQIADGFDALKERQREGRLDDTDTRVLFECSLLLAEVRYRGTGEAAQSTLMQLYAERPGFDFRVEPPAAGVPTDLADPAETASGL